MRVPFIVGNWKMNKVVGEAVDFIQQVSADLPDPKKVETGIAAPSLFLQSMVEAAKDTPLQIIGENCFYEDFGAYTGEDSPAALKDLGVGHVILGHSERRLYFHESDELINKKVHSALENGLDPIICCDETMGRKATGEKIHWVVSQIIADLRGLDETQMAHVSVAYEPSWAIGTGQSASSEQAEEGCYLIRQTIADVYSDELANNIRVLYGGSVKPDNIDEIMAKDNIDGVLVGNASLDPESFIKLANYGK
jgi:triosephosphate isomerase